MHKNLSDLTDQLLSEAKKAGAQSADAIAVSGTDLSVDVLNGALENIERSEAIEVGLRVIIGNKQACVASSLFDKNSLHEVANRAVQMANQSLDDPFIGLASKDQLAKSWNINELELYDSKKETDPTELENVALRSERAALKVKGISRIQSASASYSTQKMHLSASNGFSGGYQRSNHSLSCVAISGNGLAMERDYCSDSKVFSANLLSPEEIGKTASERTIEREGARKPKTGSFPVIFHERISSSLIGSFLAAINGSSIALGSSWLKDSIGERVFPKEISIIENPHRPRISGSRPFDAEGLPTRKRDIVNKGILSGWTLDLTTGRKLDMESTSNASRGTSSPPRPGITNISLSNGDKTFNQLLSSMGTGLLVTSMIGSTINQNTGDYSRGAAGFWVENGEIVYPVNGCTIAGNLRKMFSSMITADDGNQDYNVVVPSLLIDGLTIAGK